MLTHLSSEKFKHLIADFDSEHKYDFKCKSLTVILFRNKGHLYEKGFRDVYERLEIQYLGIRTYEVLNNEDPQIGMAYGIKQMPATLFIAQDGEYSLKQGFLDSDQVQKEIERLMLNKKDDERT